MLHLVRVSAFGGVLAVLAALAAPGDVIAQKKKDKGKAVDNGYAALPEDYKAIQNKKELTGEIVTVSGQVLTLRVDTPKVEANPKYKPNSATNSQQTRLWNDGIRLQNDYARALNAKTPAERTRLMNKYYIDYARYQNDMANINNQLLSKANTTATKDKNAGTNTTDPFIVVHNYKEYDLEIQEKVYVRKLFLPTEFDDEGNIKKYSEKEKAALKDPKGGYKSNLGEVAPGMEARLNLTPPPKKSKSETKKDDEAGAGEIERPTINTIVLLKDAPTATTSPSTDTKKKKKNQ